MKQRVLFRVDANPMIGFGHLTRCISIAQSLLDYTIIFSSTEPLVDYFQKQNLNGISFLSLTNTNDFFSLLNAEDIVFVDGYHFNTEYYTNIKDKGVKIIAIDDLAADVIIADVIINPTPLFRAAEYLAPLHAEFFIGLDYALLRPDFLKLALKESLMKKKDTLLICFGGSDPLNKTEDALEVALESRLFKEIYVVLGPGFQATERIELFAKGQSNVIIYSNLGASQMAELMSEVEYAILPCSGILLEGLAAKMKIAGGFYIENQKYVYQHHLELDSFVDAKDFKRENLRVAIQSLPNYTQKSHLIDGKSMQRIERIVRNLSNENLYTLRKATIDDTTQTFQWANYPETRKYAFNKDAISLEDHKIWFNNKINSPTCWYGILENENQSFGSIRFDIDDRIAVISYLIDPNHYGKGLGTIILKSGLKILSENFTSNEISEVHGYVMFENIASIKTFERFGFQKVSLKDVFLFTKKFVMNV